MARRPTSYNYISNEELYNILYEWKTNGNLDVIPDKLCLAIIQIANHLASSGRFAGYTWKEEMIEDAIYMSIKFCRNFDINNERKNPFAYFTQVAWNAFITRIKAEKERLAAMSDYRDQLDTMYNIEEYEGEDGVSQEGKYNYINNTAKNVDMLFKKQNAPKKKRRSKKEQPLTLDNFM